MCLCVFGQTSFLPTLTLNTSCRPHTPGPGSRNLPICTGTRCCEWRHMAGPFPDLTKQREKTSFYVCSTYKRFKHWFLLCGHFLLINSVKASSRNTWATLRAGQTLLQPVAVFGESPVTAFLTLALFPCSAAGRCHVWTWKTDMGNFNMCFPNAPNIYWFSRTSPGIIGAAPFVMSTMTTR